MHVFKNTFAVFMVVVCLSASANETDGRSGKTNSKRENVAQKAVKNFNSASRKKRVEPTFSFSLPAQNLGLTIKQAAAQMGANLVLMNGLETTPFNETTFEKATEEELCEQIALQARLEMKEMGSYRFFYPMEYASLVNSKSNGQWPSEYTENKFGLSFGADTPLAFILATLGKSLGMTFLADHTISGSLCGEIAIAEATVPDALSALLLSARIPSESIRFETSADAIFVHSARNLKRPNYRIQGTTATNDGALTENCTINLLDNGFDHSKLGTGFKKLSEIAGVLSEQLGYTIEYDPSLRDFPVTPMYMHNIPRKVALELILWQWPVPQFGYSIEKNAVHFGRF